MTYDSVRGVNLELGLQFIMMLGIIPAIPALVGAYKTDLSCLLDPPIMGTLSFGDMMKVFGIGTFVISGTLFALFVGQYICNSKRLADASCLLFWLVFKVAAAAQFVWFILQSISFFHDAVGPCASAGIVTAGAVTFVLSVVMICIGVGLGLLLVRNAPN